MIILFILFAAYSILLVFFWLGWKKMPVFNPPPAAPKLLLSVIIPARNEETNIGLLLHALDLQRYPKHLTEILVVDDHSTDRTAAIVSSFPGVRLIRLQHDAINSYKKKAIETGIAAATGEWIVTTDADCLPPADWLQQISAFVAENNPVFVAAPVVMENDHSLLQVFQSMDFMLLQGITGASVHQQKLSMCNGANLAYEKKAFYEVEGFAGVDDIASGDDMLLMHKIWKKFPGRVQYLKSPQAIVSTQSMRTWKEFLNQRIRWASKARRYDDKRIFAVLLLVYLFNLSFIVLAIAGFINPVYWAWLAAAWVFKTLVELPFFISLSYFFQKKWTAASFFLFQPLHVIYTVVSGLFGQFGTYEWKGRKVK